MQEFIVTLLVIYSIWIIGKQCMPNTMHSIRSKLIVYLARYIRLKSQPDPTVVPPPLSNNPCGNCKACGPEKQKESCDAIVSFHSSYQNRS